MQRRYNEQDGYLKKKTNKKKTKHQKKTKTNNGTKKNPAETVSANPVQPKTRSALYQPKTENKGTSQDLYNLLHLIMIQISQMYMFSLNDYFDTVPQKINYKMESSLSAGHDLLCKTPETRPAGAVHQVILLHFSTKISTKGILFTLHIFLGLWRGGGGVIFAVRLHQ